MKDNSNILPTPLVSTLPNGDAKDNAKMAVIQQYRLDGIAHYENEKRETFDKVGDGLLSIEDANYLTNILDKAKNNLATGDWITAKYDLLNTPIDSIFTQAQKDYWIAEIDEYINNNYQTW